MSVVKGCVGLEEHWSWEPPLLPSRWKSLSVPLLRRQFLLHFTLELLALCVKIH